MILARFVHQDNYHIYECQNAVARSIN